MSMGQLAMTLTDQGHVEKSFVGLVTASIPTVFTLALLLELATHQR